MGLRQGEGATSAFSLFSHQSAQGLVPLRWGCALPSPNVNNLKYAEDTTLMAESEEELKSLLMKVKRESE